VKKSDGSPIAIIGSGLIGRSWAIAFARAGHEVRLYDQAPGIAHDAIRLIHSAFVNLSELDLLSGQTPHDVGTRVHPMESLESTLQDVVYVQENTPENIAVKQAVFALLDAHTPQDAVIASSTSALLPSQFTQGLKGAARCLIAHPLNPPHLIPAVEVVPSPETSREAITKTVNLLSAIGQAPVLVRRETEGFVMNRLQGALLDEAIKLVRDGFASPTDIDTALKHGLALRWSFMGPFETIDLNAPGGLRDFAERYGPAYAAIGADRPGRVPWDQDMIGLLDDARREALPMHAHKDRQDWRDRQLAALAAHKRKTAKEIGE
jgi:L-gulonate 3-dehydrogenase